MEFIERPLEKYSKTGMSMVQTKLAIDLLFTMFLYNRFPSLKNKWWQTSVPGQ